MQKGKGEVLTNTQKKKALKYLMERIGTDWKRAETVSPDTASQVEQEAKEKLKEITAESETTTLERDNSHTDLSAQHHIFVRGNA